MKIEKTPISIFLFEKFGYSGISGIFHVKREGEKK